MKNKMKNKINKKYLLQKLTDSERVILKSYSNYLYNMPLNKNNWTLI